MGTILRRHWVLGLLACLVGCAEAADRAAPGFILTAPPCSSDASYESPPLDLLHERKGRIVSLGVQWEQKGTLQVVGADVDYDPPSDLDSLFAYAPMALGPATTGCLVVTLLPPGNLDRLRSDRVPYERRIHARVVAQGILDDGSQVRSNQLVIPLDICVGCLPEPEANPWR